MTSVPAAAHPSPPDRPERPSTPTGRDLPPPWPAWSSVAALIAGFGAATVAAVMIGLLGALGGASLSDPPPSVGIPSIVAQDACLIGAALLFARMTAIPRPWQFGLRPPRSVWVAAGLVVAGYLVFLGFSAGWLAAIGQSNEKDTITKDLGADDSTIALILVTFVVTVCAPLAEEFFFRGYFFGALRRQGLWPAAVLTGICFGLVHVFGSPIAFLLPLACLGTGLCLLRNFTGSLYPCIALHCMNNSFAMASSEHWGWEIPVTLVGAALCITLLIRLGLRVWGPDPDTVRAPSLA